MAFLGGFMQPDYNQNPGIIGLQQYIQSGYDAGKARAQNDALRQLSQKAYTDTGDAQQQDIAQAIGIDPQAGYALAGQARQQQAAQQAQKLAAFQRLGKAASAIIQAKQAGDETTAEGIYQAIVPELSLMSAQHGGPTPPPTLQGADMGALYKVAAMYASLPQPAKGVVIAAGGQLVNPTTGATMAKVPNKGQVVNGYYFNPNTGTASQIPIQGAPNGMGMGQAASGTNPGFQGAATSPNGQNVTFDFPPGTPPEVIAAAKASAVANGDLAPGQQVGAPPAQAQPRQPQTLAQVVTGKSGAAPPAGYQWNAGHTALQAIPGGPADKTQAVAALGDPTLQGDAYLSSIQDAGLQQLVKAIAEGREQVPRIYRSGKAGEIGPTQIAAAVAQYDPTFNQQDFNSRNRTRISFTSGTDSKNMMNLNQAAAHAQQLAEQIPQLAGHFLPFGLSDPLNKALNNSTQAGTAALKAWNTTADALAHEVRAVFAGSSGGTLEELNRNLQTLNGNDPITSKQAALQSIGRLLQSRIALLQDKYEKGMGKAADPFATTYPDAARVLDALANGDPSKIGYGELSGLGHVGNGASVPRAAPSGWSIEEIH